jgi:hypothetical protein
VETVAKKPTQPEPVKQALAVIDQTDAMSLIIDAGELGFHNRPDFIPSGDKSGTEDIGAHEIRLPRLVIAQGTSDEVLPGEKRIPGLEVTQMFNDSTKQIYGNGPLFFIPVRRDVKAIEFRPRKEGGGIIDMNVPTAYRGGKFVDERLNWTAGPDGTRLAPKATMFDEYISLLLFGNGDAVPVAISIKHSNKDNRRAVTDLNGFIKMHASQGDQSVPIYGVIYSIRTRPVPGKEGGVYGVPVIDQVGYVPTNEPGPTWYRKAMEYAQDLSDKTIVIDREAGSDDDEVDAGASTPRGGKAPF